MVMSRLARRFYSLSNGKTIEALLQRKYKPDLLEVIDESFKHKEAFDSHFRVYISSDSFIKMTYLQRHREVMSLFKEEGIMEKIHAVSLTARTIEEHERSDIGGLSPPCLNKTK